MFVGVCACVYVWTLLSVALTVVSGGVSGSFVRQGVVGYGVGGGVVL